MSVVITSVVNDAVVLAGVAGTIFGFSKKKWFQAGMTFVKGEEATIVKGVETLIHTPAAKAVEAKLHLELNSAADDLKKSALSQYAQAVIAGAGKLYGSFSDSEKAAALSWIQNHMPKTATATAREIESALKDAPSLANLFKGDPGFVKAQEFDSVLLAAHADNAPQTSPTDNGQATQPAVS